MVIRRMIRDLHFNTTMHICPTVREPDDLAMSSRNTYLSPSQRKHALVLYRALKEMERLYHAGTRHAPTLVAAARDIIETTRVEVESTESWKLKLDYISVASPDDLSEITGDIDDDTGCIMSGAVFVGTTRIIDNLVINVQM